MNPSELGRKYDKIARWWHERHDSSAYGMSQLERALTFCPAGRQALDVGCGSGGRMIRRLHQKGFAVTGIDISAEMLQIARRNHPEAIFEHQDISTWQSTRRFDLIVAWDSIFHLPLAQQRPVLDKLTGLLDDGGILLYTFGDANGEHTDRWHDDDFYYSSIGIDGNLDALLANGLKVLHLELDQYPEMHVVIMAAHSGRASS